MSVIIRRAVADDIPNLLPLIAKICEFHQSRDSARYGFLPNVEQLYPRWLRGIIADSEDLCLIAEDRQEETSQETQPESQATVSKPIAFLIATLEQEVPIYVLKQYGYIHDLWVEADYRRSGVAKALVMQAIEHFRQQGVAQVRLDTLTDNEAASKLYDSCGFRPSTMEMLIEL